MFSLHIHEVKKPLKKIKKPQELPGAFSASRVDPERIELSSKQGINKLSTSLEDTWLSA